MHILDDMPLGKKIALLATLWLILAVGVFSFLAYPGRKPGYRNDASGPTGYSSRRG